MRYAKNKHYEALRILKEEEQDFECWKRIRGAELASLKVQRQAMHAIRRAEQHTLKDVKELTAKIKSLEADKTRLEKELSPQRKKEEELKKVVQDLYKDIRYEARWFRAEIEKKLRQNSVDQGAHHGGEIPGESARNLMLYAATIFGDFEDNQLVVSDDMEDKLRLRLDSYSTCLTRFDLHTSLLYQDASEYEGGKEKLIADAKKARDRALSLWHQLGLSVTPKLHVLEDHAIEFIVELGDLTLYDEQFVERSHQKGKKDNKHTMGAARDAERKFRFFARREESCYGPKHSSSKGRSN